MREYRDIAGTDEVAESEELAFHGRDPVRIDADAASRPSIYLLYLDHDVSAADVVHIVGECAYRMEDLLWIPVLLELDAVVFDKGIIYQALDIDG